VAATASYASVDEYRAAAGKDELESDEAIEQILDGISRWIDRRTDRFFGQEGSVASPVTRSYVAEAPRRLVIDDLVSVSAIRITDPSAVTTPVYTLAAADYLLWPLNAPLGSEPAPYREIRVPSTSTFTAFVAGTLVEIDGVWGWPAVPSAVSQATIELARIWRIESPRATVQVDSMGTSLGMSQEARKIVASLADSYRRRWFVV